MWWNSITNFFSGILLQNLILIVTILVAIIVGSRQIWLNDVVELYAFPSTIKSGNNELPIILVQNVGTRLVYMDKYVFNGKTYITDGQVLPSTYSQAEGASYWIRLPINGEVHVSLEIYYRDLDGRKWRSDIFADVDGEIWKVKTLPRY